MASERVTVYRWKSSFGDFTSATCVIFALRTAGRVVEIDTEQDGKNEWWLVLKAVVPLPSKARKIIEGVSDAK